MLEGLILGFPILMADFGEGRVGCAGLKDV